MRARAESETHFDIDVCERRASAALVTFARVFVMRFAYPGDSRAKGASEKSTLSETGEQRRKFRESE